MTGTTALYCRVSITDQNFARQRQRTSEYATDHLGITLSAIEVYADKQTGTDTDRDYRPVHDDVTVLDKCGLVFVVEESRAKRPYVPYRRVHLDVELAADMASEEPTLCKYRNGSSGVKSWRRIRPAELTA